MKRLRKIKEDEELKALRLLFPEAHNVHIHKFMKFQVENNSQK